MKRIISIMMTAILLIGLASCTKQQLVGRWKYSSQGLTEDGVQYNVDVVETLNEDGTFVEAGKITYTTTYSEDGANLKCVIELPAKYTGTWKLTGENIEMTPTKVGVKIGSVKYYNLSDNSLLQVLSNTEAAEYFSETCQEIKTSLAKPSCEEIVSIDDDHYVTEAPDEDGKNTITTYTKVK